MCEETENQAKSSPQAEEKSVAQEVNEGQVVWIELEEPTEEKEPENKEPEAAVVAESLCVEIEAPIVVKTADVKVPKRDLPLPNLVKEKKESQITFTMYCRLKDIPDRHRAGMRAFTKTQRATFHEWERVFSHY